MSVSQKLFAQFVNGDKKAIEKVYLEYRNLMFFVIASYVPSQYDAEDILSDAFIKVVEHCKELKEFDKLKAFLTAIAKNTALDFIRKQREIPSSDVIDDIYGERDRSNNILSMLEPLLNNKETIVVYLKAGFSYTWSEIAAETGISESTARRLYEKAKEKLRKEYL